MNDSLNSEDKLVVSKAYDTIYLCEKRHCATFYGFLNEHEVQVIKDNVYLTEECLFWGGYSDARRVVFGCGENDFLSFQQIVLNISIYIITNLTHKLHIYFKNYKLIIILLDLFSDNLKTKGISLPSANIFIL